jgi:hypothetical protein
MNKTKYTNCTKIGRKIFNNIIDNVDIKGVINDCIGKYPDRLACCSIRVGEGEDDYLTRYRPKKIDTKSNTIQCSLCRKERTIIDWCSRFMDLSIADTVKFIDESCDGLDLFDIDSLDDSDKYEVIFAIREFNELYIEAKSSNKRIC